MKARSPSSVRSKLRFSAVSTRSTTSRGSRAIIDVVFFRVGGVHGTSGSSRPSRRRERRRRMREPNLLRGRRLKPLLAGREQFALSLRRPASGWPISARKRGDLGLQRLELVAADQVHVGGPGRAWARKAVLASSPAAWASPMAALVSLASSSRKRILALHRPPIWEMAGESEGLVRLGERRRASPRADGARHALGPAVPRLRPGAVRRSRRSIWAR